VKLRVPKRSSRAEIDMVPMINFAFLLLVFFLLVGRIAPLDPLDVQPARSHGFDPAQQASDVLLVGADGRVAFGGEVLAPAAVAAQLSAWAAAHPGAPLPVKADARLEATAAIALLDTLRDAGVRDVRLLTVQAR
jgi:biopolymer transport protein ExbD